MKLTARRSFTYATRHLVAGDVFEAPDIHGIILIARRKAKPAEEKLISQPPVVNVILGGWGPYDEDVDPVKLRQVAESRGITVDGRWGAKRLQAEIDAVAKPSTPA